ncbi:hypothetical protein GBAR_LOCUS17612 [Geodia barretti]|uniref:Uncharacterized protein n=1 Tax=Geodia barretti TaxID=519541 RepID=A0AA35SJ47_GEOBA|nr:hypothetical protein GBAR_LOCUS17612 [Geodia barretti]
MTPFLLGPHSERERTVPSPGAVQRSLTHRPHEAGCRGNSGHLGGAHGSPRNCRHREHATGILIVIQMSQCNCRQTEYTHQGLHTLAKEKQKQNDSQACTGTATDLLKLEKVPRQSTE